MWDITHQRKALVTLITMLEMETKIQHEGFIHTVHAYSNNSIYGVMTYCQKKEKYVET